MIRRCLVCVVIFNVSGGDEMKLIAVIHKAEEGGYWAEVPAIPGCATQGETIEELKQNLYEAIEGCLSLEKDSISLDKDDEIMELSL